MRAINASVMRQVNRTMILNRIRMRPISRAELAEETGLTRASVTQIVEELINDGMVIETSVVERSRLGRRSTQLAINPEAGYIFGVMLRPLGCTVGAVDMLGRVQMSNFEITDGRNPSDALDAIAENIRLQMEHMKIDRRCTYGIGVCVPGTVDPLRGKLIDLPGMERWNGVMMRAELEERTQMRVYLETTANAQALEQKLFCGAGEHFALVRLENTLSVGIVVQDALYRGAPDFCVELGQSPADPEGRCILNKRIEELVQGGNLQNISHMLASVMCAYQVKHVILAGKVGMNMAPLLPELTERVRALMPESVRDQATLSTAQSDPVRIAVTAAYNRIFTTSN